MDAVSVLLMSTVRARGLIELDRRLAGTIGANGDLSLGVHTDAAHCLGDIGGLVCLVCVEWLA